MRQNHRPLIMKKKRMNRKEYAHMMHLSFESGISFIRVYLQQTKDHHAHEEVSVEHAIGGLVGTGHVFCDCSRWLL